MEKTSNNGEEKHQTEISECNSQPRIGNAVLSRLRKILHRIMADTTPLERGSTQVLVIISPGSDFRLFFSAHIQQHFKDQVW